MEDREIIFSYCNGPITRTEMKIIKCTIPEFRQFLNKVSTKHKYYLNEIRDFSINNKPLFKFLKNYSSYMIGGECNKRGKEYLKNIYMLPIDLDNVPHNISFSDIFMRCINSGYSFVNWTTFSHLVFKDQEGNYLPKFRIYLILKEPVYPDKFHILPKLHQQLAESIFDPTWIDKKSYVLSQAMFLPIQFNKEPEYVSTKEFSI